MMGVTAPVPRLESQDDIGYLTGLHSAEDYANQIWTAESPMTTEEGDGAEG